jgi:RNA polymerase sigma-70 factor (ECF subfamily)
MTQSHYAIPKKIMPMVNEKDSGGIIRQIDSEVEEIDAARANPRQFSVLYNRCYEPVFRFIYQRLDSKDLAADICAQVFLKAMTHLQSYKHMGQPFVCWLYRIAGNELKQLFRKNSRHRTINVETSGLHSLMEEAEDSYLDIYHDKMLEILPDLPEDDLQLIEMRYFEKRPFKEIGDILSITENNAKVKVYRILEKIKKTLTAKNYYNVR